MTVPPTIPRAVRAAAAKFGDHIAVADGEVRLTFADLHALVRDTGRGYAALGVRPGDRVCLWAPNTWQWIVAGLAISYAGGTLVPLNTRYKGHEVVDVIDRTDAVVLVVADGFLGRSQINEIHTAAGELVAASELGAEGDVIEGL
ncbi:MAG: AMP-binding protein, partial [Nocardioides sp.]|nr:AMP-binding protein [Nocardioides sp.]